VSDVAARVAAEAVQRSFAARGSEPAVSDIGAVGAASGAVIRRQAEAIVQRDLSSGDSDAPPGGGATGEETRRKEWLSFAASDEFATLIMESIEDRLMDAIERRGGRYGGWFA
jgi:hypothetical protein